MGVPGVLYFDKFTSSTGFQDLVKKREHSFPFVLSNFGEAHDFMRFSVPPPLKLILDAGYSPHEVLCSGGSEIESGSACSRRSSTSD